MGKTFTIEKLQSAPKAFVGLTERVNQLIKAVKVLSEMKGDGNINVEVTDANVLFSLGGVGRSRIGGGGSLGFDTFLFVRESEPTKVIVDFGTVGNIDPSNINSDFTISSSTDVYVEISTTSAGFSNYKVSSCEIKVGTTPAPLAPNSTTGEPPSTFYVKLATVTFTSGSIETIQNTGNGSLSFGLTVVGRICVEGEGGEPDEIKDVRDIVFYRMQP